LMVAPDSTKKLFAVFGIRVGCVMGLGFRVGRAMGLGFAIQGFMSGV
jgi:hypothetical protein